MAQAYAGHPCGVIGDHRDRHSSPCQASHRRLNPQHQRRRQMNAKRRAASLLLGVLLAACAATPASPTPTGSPPPVPMTTPSSTATPALPSASPAATPAPAASPSVTSIASATPSSATKDEGRPACPDPPTHVVAAGETLSGIAQGYGVTVQALRAANPQIRDPRLIHPGDAIVISPIDLGASWVSRPPADQRPRPDRGLCRRGVWRLSRLPLAGRDVDGPRHARGS